MTRQEVIQESIKHGCNKDLVGKGMALSPDGDIFCISSNPKKFADNHFNNVGGIVEYWGIYPKNFTDPLDPIRAESQKNIAVLKTKDNDRYVYFYVKPNPSTDYYEFYGKYKCSDYELTKNPMDEQNRDNSILFTLRKVDDSVSISLGKHSDEQIKQINEIVIPRNEVNIEKFDGEWQPISILNDNSNKYKYDHAGIYYLK